MSNDAATGIGSGVWQSQLSSTEQSRLVSVLEGLAVDPFLRRVAQRSIELMCIRAGDRVLDVGCGAGVLLVPLAELVGPGGHVTGADYSPALLETARARVDAAGVTDRVSLIEADAVALPFGDESFDSVHVERVLMHLEDPDAAIREMQRVVRPGGWIVAAEPDTIGIRIDHPADPEAMALIARRDFEAMRNPGIGLELNRRFAQAGLVERRVEPMADFDGSYDAISAEGDRAAAASLVADGSLDRERADAAIEYLVSASKRGEYSWIGTMVIAAGRLPGSPA